MMKEFWDGFKEGMYHSYRYMAIPAMKIIALLILTAMIAIIGHAILAAMGIV